MRHPLRTIPLVGALSLASSSAAAQCVVTPAPDGEISTWLVHDGGRVAVPARPSLRASLERALNTGESGLRTLPERGDPALWRPAAAASTSLDLNAALRRQGPGVVWLAASLRVQRAGRRWLSIGTDDAAEVFLDGASVFRRVAVRASRADDDLAPLTLAAGLHSLVIKVASRGDMDALLRLVGDDHRPDDGVRVELPGITDAECDALGDRGLAVDVRRGVAPEGLRVTLSLSWPGGVAHPLTRSALSLAVTGGAGLRSEVPLGGASVAPLDAVVAMPDGPGALQVQVGAVSRTIDVAPRPLAVRALRRAWAELAAMDPSFGVEPPPFPRATPRLPAGVSEDALWSVERAAERLAGLTATGDRDAAHLDAEATLLLTLLDELRAGRDPYLTLRGPLRRAYRSPLDGALQEYSVYVPPSYRPDTPMPVVVGLHGLHGSAHRMLPILVGLYDESDSRGHAERHLPALPETRAILVAPWGFGDAGYRQQGEHDVVTVVERVRENYRTDVNRTYMTGLSMGGIGAAGVPFHHPDLFAASAALCGYHSYFVRGDTRGARRPWETYLMELRSNDRIAENGLHLPMYIVQGTLDRPLAHSQVLAERYTALGYSLQAEWPALGHNVWSTTYANGRIVPWFLQHRRDPTPSTIRLRTYELRWNRSAWLTLDALSARAADVDVPVRAGRAGEVRLTAAREGVVRGTTDGVYALTLAPPRTLFARSPERVSLVLDDDRLELRTDAPNHLARVGGHWQLRPTPLRVPAGGPVREVFDTPLVFVVGTADPSLTRVHERVARAWARRTGVPLAYPVVTDAALTDAMAEGRTLVLIGTPRSNRVLARIADRLPVRFDGAELQVGARRHTGNDLGVVFATHHPDHPERAVVVIAGNSPAALYRSLSLPDLIPAYTVFDEQVAPARGQVLLGGRARVRAAGFFDAEGRPMPNDQDPVQTLMEGDE